MSKTFLSQASQFNQTIHFSISMPLVLSGATTPDQSGPGNDGNKGVLCNPQNSSITGTSPSDCLVSYPGRSLGWGLTPLQRYSRCVLQPQNTRRVDMVLEPTNNYFDREVSLTQIQGFELKKKKIFLKWNRYWLKFKLTSVSSVREKKNVGNIFRDEKE